MKKYLIDSKAKSFWGVETLGKSYTITSGPVGAKGTSRTITCTSPEKCISEVTRLISEKREAGYKQKSKEAIAAMTPAGGKELKADASLLDIFNANKKTDTIAAFKAAQKILVEGTSENSLKAVIPWMNSTLKDTSQIKLLQQISTARERKELSNRVNYLKMSGELKPLRFVKDVNNLKEEIAGKVLLLFEDAKTSKKLYTCLAYVGGLERGKEYDIDLFVEALKSSDFFDVTPDQIYTSLVGSKKLECKNEDNNIFIIYN